MKQERLEDRNPWATWFDGQIRRSAQGEQFPADVDPHDFRRNAHAAARKRGLMLKARVVGVVYAQALDKA